MYASRLLFSPLKLCYVLVLFISSVITCSSVLAETKAPALAESGPTGRSAPTMLVQNKRIFILQIVDHPALNATRKGIEDELKEAGFTAQYEVAQGNPSLSAQIAQKFVGKKPDILIGIGTTAAQSLSAARRAHPIPIVFSSVTDPKLAGLVEDLSHPENNITGVSNFLEPRKQFELLKKSLPALSKLGIIYNPGEANSVSLIQKMQAQAPEFGFSLVLATATNTGEIAQATQSLIHKVDAIFVNNDNTALAAFESISKIASQNKIPVFVSDVDLFDKGALAAFGPNQYEIGRQTGKMAIQILQGAKPETLPVLFPDKIEWRKKK